MSRPAKYVMWWSHTIRTLIVITPPLPGHLPIRRLIPAQLRLDQDARRSQRGALVLLSLFFIFLFFFVFLFLRPGMFLDPALDLRLSALLSRWRKTGSELFGFRLALF